MTRLPIPGSDDGQWGQILNDFLLVAHQPDGSLQIADIVAAKYVKPVTGIPKTDLADDVQAALDSAVSGVAPDASPTVKGLVRLSGDLTGDALSPLIAAGKVTGGGGGAIAGGTITNDNIHASAAIAKSKLAPLGLTNDDIAVGAAIVQSKIVNLTSDLAAKAGVVHAHAIGDVTNLQSVLDGKAATSHGHAAADISSGTLAIARIPTGTTSTTVALGDHAHANYSVTGHGHTIADTADLQTTLDSKAPLSHAHSVANVTGLQTILDDKAAAVHNHAISGVTNLQTTLDGKASTVHTHTIANTTGLQAALDSKSVDGHGHAIADVEDLQSSLAAKTDVGHGHIISEVANLQSSLDAKAASSHSHTIANTTGLQTALDNKSAVGHAHVLADTNGLQAALDAKAAMAHSHAIIDVTNLQTSLDAKSDTGHGHAIADTTGLQAALDGKATTSHNHTIANTTGLQTALDGKAAIGHVHVLADTTGLQTALDGKAALSHTHLASNISNFSDSVADVIGNKVAAGENIAVQYDSITGLTTISSTVAPETGEPSDSVLSVAGRTGNVVLAAGDIATGTFSDLRIPNLDTNKITTGTLDIARIPTGTTGTTVALGDHAHANYAALSHNHVVDDVAGLQTTLDGKSDDGHGHVIADTSGLQTALDGKAATSHVHTIANTTGLQTALDSKAASTHAHNASDINAGTLAIARIPTGTTSTTVALGDHAHANYAATAHGHVVSDVDELQGLLDDKAAAVHTHSISSTTGLQAALDGKSATTHGHTIADTTGLQSSLDNKSDLGHGHAITDVEDLDTALADKSDVSHGHTINDVANLQSSLTAKADTIHTHSIANVTNLQTTLDGKAASSHGHAAADTTSGTFDIARIPTGTTGTTVALGNHAHSGYAATSHAHATADITSGTFDIARIPTGTSASSVALGAHGHGIADITNLQTSLDGKAPSVHTHDDRYYTETEVDSALSAKINVSEKGAANGLATLGADSKIPANQLPSLAIKDTFTVASQAAMLALVAQRGDMAIRTDNGDTFVLASDDPTTLGDWKKLTNGYTSPVASVAGKTGAVTLVKADVGLGNVDNTADASKPVSTAMQTALDAKAATVHTHAISDTTNLQTTLDAKIPLTQRGAASGVATLDTGTKIPIAQVPTGTTSTTVSLGNHTHTIANVTSLQTTLDAKIPLTQRAAASGVATLDASTKIPIAQVPTGTTASTVALGAHTHAISDTTNLQTTLDAKIAATEKAAASGVATLDSGSKIPIAQVPTGSTSTTVALGNHTHAGFAATSHTHAISDTTNLQATLDAKVAASEKAAVNGIATLDATTRVPIAQLPMGSGFDQVAYGVHSHLIFDVTDLQETLDAKIDTTQRGAANGVAALGSDGKVPTAQLPAVAVSSVAGKTGAVTLAKADVGLGSVDNTADLAKPISTATQTALDSKASIVIDPVNESTYPDGTIFLYTA